MKKIFFIASFVILSVLAISIDANAQPQLPGCFNLTPGCGAWANATRTLTIPGYTCPITVYYKWRSCPDPNCPNITMTQVYVWGISWSNISICLTFTRSVFPQWPNTSVIDWNFVNQAFRESFRQATRLDFMDMYNQTPAPFKPLLECTGNPCTFPSSGCHAVASSYEGSCVSYCLGYTPPSTHGDVGTVSINKTICSGSGDACCLLKRAYCYCPSTGTVLTNETITPVPFKCDPSSIPTPPPCAGEYVYQSNCMPTCP